MTEASPSARPQQQAETRLLRDERDNKGRYKVVCEHLVGALNAFSRDIFTFALRVPEADFDDFYYGLGDGIERLVRCSCRIELLESCAVPQDLDAHPVRYWIDPEARDGVRTVRFSCSACPAGHFAEVAADKRKPTFPIRVDTGDPVVLDPASVARWLGDLGADRVLQSCEVLQQELPDPVVAGNVLADSESPCLDYKADLDLGKVEELSCLLLNASLPENADPRIIFGIEDGTRRIVGCAKPVDAFVRDLKKFEVFPAVDVVVCTAPVAVELGDEDLVLVRRSADEERQRNHPSQKERPKSYGDPVIRVLLNLEGQAETALREDGELSLVLSARRWARMDEGLRNEFCYPEPVVRDSQGRLPVKVVPRGLVEVVLGTTLGSVGAHCRSTENLLCHGLAASAHLSPVGLWLRLASAKVPAAVSPLVVPGAFGVVVALVFDEPYGRDAASADASVAVLGSTTANFTVPLGDGASITRCRWPKDPFHAVVVVAVSAVNGSATRFQRWFDQQGLDKERVCAVLLVGPSAAANADREKLNAELLGLSLLTTSAAVVAGGLPAATSGGPVAADAQRNVPLVSEVFEVVRLGSDVDQAGADDAGVASWVQRCAEGYTDPPPWCAFRQKPPVIAAVLGSRDTVEWVSGFSDHCRPGLQVRVVTAATTGCGLTCHLRYAAARVADSMTCVWAKSQAPPHGDKSEWERYLAQWRQLLSWALRVGRHDQLGFFCDAGHFNSDKCYNLWMTAVAREAERAGVLVVAVVGWLSATPCRQVQVMGFLNRHEIDSLVSSLEVQVSQENRTACRKALSGARCAASRQRSPLHSHLHVFVLAARLLEYLPAEELIWSRWEELADVNGGPELAKALSFVASFTSSSRDFPEAVLETYFPKAFEARFFRDLLVRHLMPTVQVVRGDRTPVPHLHVHPYFARLLVRRLVGAPELWRFINGVPQRAGDNALRKLVEMAEGCSTTLKPFVGLYWANATLDALTGDVAPLAAVFVRAVSDLDDKEYVNLVERLGSLVEDASAVRSQCGCRVHALVFRSRVLRDRSLYVRARNDATTRSPAHEVRLQKLLTESFGLARQAHDEAVRADDDSVIYPAVNNLAHSAGWAASYKVEGADFDEADKKFDEAYTSKKKEGEEAQRQVARSAYRVRWPEELKKKWGRRAGYDPPPPATSPGRKRTTDDEKLEALALYE